MAGRVISGAYTNYAVFCDSEKMYVFLKRGNSIVRLVPETVVSYAVSHHSAFAGRKIYCIEWQDGRKSMIGIPESWEPYLASGCEIGALDDRTVRENKKSQSLSRITKIVVCGILLSIFLMFIASYAHNYSTSENTTISTKEKRLKWAVWDDPENPDTIPNADIVVVQDGTENKGYGYGTIYGRLLNRTGSRLSYVQISFDLYSEGGVKVGSCLDNINGLEHGETWGFSAYCGNYPESGTYKIDSVTYW